MIAGSNILLREPLIDDLEFFMSWHNDMKLKKLAMMPPFIVTAVEEKKWLTDLISGVDTRRKTFVIVGKQDNEPVGYTQFTEINRNSKNAKFGIVIGNWKMQGKGIGEETTRLMIRYGFEELDLQKISLEVIEENKQALGLYEKLGFLQEGYLARQFLNEGQYYNVILMALLK